MNFFKELSLFEKVMFVGGCIAIVSLILPFVTASLFGYSESMLALEKFWLWVAVVLINLPIITMFTKVPQLSLKPVKYGAPILGIIITFLVSNDLTKDSLGFVKNSFGFYVLLLSGIVVLIATIMQDQTQ